MLSSPTESQNGINRPGPSNFYSHNNEVLQGTYQGLGATKSLQLNKPEV